MVMSLQPTYSYGMMNFNDSNLGCLIVLDVLNRSACLPVYPPYHILIPGGYHCDRKTECVSFTNNVSMNDVGPARLLALYGGTTFLVYVETDGFRQQTSSMMFGLPLMTLSFLSLTSSMQPRARFSTAASFAILAMSRYLLVSKSSWELMVIGYTLVTAGNMMYLYSFYHLIEEWSIALSMFGTMFYCTWSYICFADLSASIPFLVFLHACSFGSACVLVVASGSVCMNPTETDNDAYQASIIRFVGTFLNMGSNTIFLASVFGRRVETLQVISRIMFYIAEGLMFLANERTF